MLFVCWWLLVVVVIGCSWLFVVDCGSLLFLVDRCFLFLDCSSLFVVLVVVCFSVVGCILDSLLFVCCCLLLFGVCCLLFGLCLLCVFVVCRLLFVGFCCLHVVCDV